MTDTATLGAFAQGLALSAGLILAIGPQNAFVLRQGVRRERVGAVVAISAFCDVALILAGAFGMAALFAASAWLLALATWGGAAFLAWYAVSALRRALGPDAALGTAAGGGTGVVASAWALALLNPHVYLDTVVILGAVAGSFETLAARGGFAAGASVASIAWFVALGYGARVLAPIFAKPIAWRALDLFVAATMAFIAVSLMREALN
jgi:L-lysine exporter family protein LysE/ArgO